MLSASFHNTHQARPLRVVHELETARLKLRMFTPDDLPQFSRITSDPEVMRYIGEGEPISVEEAKFNLMRIIDSFEKRGYGRWAVVDKKSHTLIGYCGLTLLDPAVGVEVAYLIAKPFWGMGLATEATQACLRYGFDELHLDRIAAITKYGNTGSQRVMEKAGMMFDKRGLHCGVDCIHYTISKEKFKFVHAPYAVTNKAGNRRTKVGSMDKANALIQ